MRSDLHSYWLLCDKCDLRFVLSRQHFATLNASFVFTKVEGYGCRIISTCPTSSSEFSFRRDRKACGVSQRRHTAIQHALTIFVRDSYDRLIHFSILIVITVIRAVAIVVIHKFAIIRCRISFILLLYTFPNIAFDNIIDTESN